MTPYIHRTFLGLGLLVLCLSLACAPKLAGPTAPSGYVFSLQAVPSLVTQISNNSKRKEDSISTLVVKLQDAGGRPVDGVPVEFQLVASWGQDATLSPTRAITKDGRAEAQFQATNIGIAPVLARVENVTQQVEIAVSPRSDGASGAADGG